MKNMKKLLAVLIAAMMLLASSAFAETAITVTGTGTVYIPADTADITVGVRTQAADVASAQQQANKVIAAIREALTAYGIHEQDINTANIDFYTLYDYDTDIPTVKGYQASSSVTVRTGDISGAGDIIDLSIAAGANSLSGISFSASDSSDAEDEALRSAVADAKSKAEVLADASGLKITGIANISAGSVSNYDSGMVFAEKAAMEDNSGSGETYVQAAKLCVSASVSIQFTAE